MDTSLIHTWCFPYTISGGTELSLNRIVVTLPIQGSVSLSDVWAVFRDELTLPTGACSACPPTGEHLCECLPDDADDLWDLGPVWYLECDW